MATAPLTRLTRWLEPRILRFAADNGVALGAALAAMMTFGHRSLGPMGNLAIAALAFAAWRLATTRRGSDLIGRAALATFEALLRLARWNRTRKGTAAMLARFPKTDEGSLTHRIAQATLNGPDGQPLYQIRILADPLGSHAGDTIEAIVGTTNIRRASHSFSRRMPISVTDGFAVFKIADLDPNAPMIGDETLVVDLASGRTLFQSWKTEPAEHRARQPRAAGTDAVIAVCLADISDDKVRAEASRIARSIEAADAAGLAALRREAARALHPDVCKVPGAPAALAAINARIDAIEAARAA